MDLNDMQEGVRVRIARAVDFDLGVFPVGLTGTVVATELHCPEEPMVEVRLDEHFAALSEWDNCLYVYLAPDDCSSENWERVPFIPGHRCWKCDSGRKPCVQGRPGVCDYPRALND